MIERDQLLTMLDKLGRAMADQHGYVQLLQDTYRRERAKLSELRREYSDVLAAYDQMEREGSNDPRH